MAMTLTTETTPMQEMVDGQLAKLTITGNEVPGTDYKTAHALKIKALDDEEAALPAPTDKASLQLVQDFITKTERARTGVDKWRKALLDPIKAGIDSLNGYLGTNKEGGLQAKLYAIQERAEAKKKAYLDEQAKAQREAERLLEERYQGRVAKLIEAGLTFDAQGSLTITHEGQTFSALPNSIRFATDEQMATVLTKAGDIAHAKREAEAAALQAKEAEEREHLEEAERLATQKREQDAEQAKLKADREALEKEKEQMADHRAETRGADLVVLGAVCHGYGPAIRYEISNVIIGHAELRHMDPEVWIATRERVRLAKAKAIEADKEYERQMLLRDARIEEVRALGATHEFGILTIGEVAECESNYGKLTSDEWAPVLARFKEAAEARGKAAEELQERHAEALPGAFLKLQKDIREGFDKIGPVMAELQEGSAVVGEQLQNAHDELDAKALATYRDLLLAVEYPTGDDLFRAHNVEIVADLRNVIADRLTQ